MEKQLKFHKIAFEDYVKGMNLSDTERNWIHIQYDNLREPKQLSERVYSIYAPNNFSIISGESFSIPVGFSCDYNPDKFEIAVKMTDVDMDCNIDMDKYNQIILNGISSKNMCICEESLIAIIAVKDKEK